MRRLSIVLLCLTASFYTTAQKQHIYADGGLSFAYFDPGFSATYNYYPVKHLGLGIGTQGYVFHVASTNPRHFTPAAFADIRFRIRPEKISQYFLLLDIGMNFYKHNNDTVIVGDYVYSVPKDNGLYIGMGIGYFLRLTYRGWGPYVTAKLITNRYQRNEYNYVTHEQGINHPGAGTLILSLGFRFMDDTKEYTVHR